MPIEEFRNFLKGDCPDRPFVILDPSTYAAEFTGKSGGYATYDDNLAFQQAFPNDCPVSAFVFPDALIPELAWDRNVLKKNGLETYYQETIAIPGGKTCKRIVADRPGTQPWIVTAPVQQESDFDLIDYYAHCVRQNASLYRDTYQDFFKSLKQQGFMPGMVLLTAFEVYYLIDYPDMPLFYYDHTDRYLASVEKVHQANLAVAHELLNAGCEIFLMGSAGLELLSPRIFDEAIIPFVRQTTDFIHQRGGFSNYHICGHSYQLLKSGRINELHPTWFETFSSPPCGNNENLTESLKLLDETIISKGNLSLELLRNGTPAQVRKATQAIVKTAQGRRHIVGQADATILSGTPVENIRAFLAAVQD